LYDVLLEQALERVHGI
jgi:hypothetical protein